MPLLHKLGFFFWRFARIRTFYRAVYLARHVRSQYSGAFHLTKNLSLEMYAPLDRLMGVAIGGVEVRLEERHETPMNLQLLRGRDLRPPSRHERGDPAGRAAFHARILRQRSDGSRRELRHHGSGGLQG